MRPREQYPSPELRQAARNLRKRETDAEKALWNILRGKKVGGYKFRRQHPIGRFVPDFYCHAAKLIVELDGDIHREQIEYDAERDNWFEVRGYGVLRFTNERVLNDESGVVREILRVCNQRTPTPSPSPLGRGEPDKNKS